MDEALRKQWIISTKRKNFDPSQFAVLCSKHFEDDAFEVGGLIRKLKKNAVPTIFNFSSNVVPSKRKNKRRLSRAQKSYSSIKSEHSSCEQNEISRPCGSEGTNSIDIEEHPVLIKQELVEENSELVKHELDKGTNSIDIEEHPEIIKQELVEENSELVKHELDKNNYQEETVQSSTIWIKEESHEVLLEECQDDPLLDKTPTEIEKNQAKRIKYSKHRRPVALSKKLSRKRTSQPSSQVVSQGKPTDTPVLSPVTTASSATLIAAPICEQGAGPGSTKKFLLLLPQQCQGAGVHPILTPLRLPQLSQPVLLPQPPPVKPVPTTPVIDDSETFIISLAHFDSQTRMTIKRKLIEVVDNFNKHNIPAEVLPSTTTADAAHDTP